jgi:hypothetical protein
MSDHSTSASSSKGRVNFVKKVKGVTENTHQIIKQLQDIIVKLENVTNDMETKKSTNLVGPLIINGIKEDVDNCGDDITILSDEFSLLSKHFDLFIKRENNDLSGSLLLNSVFGRIDEIDNKAVIKTISGNGQQFNPIEYIGMDFKKFTTTMANKLGITYIDNLHIVIDGKSYNDDNMPIINSDAVKKFKGCTIYLLNKIK